MQGVLVSLSVAYAGVSKAERVGLGFYRVWFRCHPPKQFPQSASSPPNVRRRRRVLALRVFGWQSVFAPRAEEAVRDLRGEGPLRARQSTESVYGVRGRGYLFPRQAKKPVRGVRGKRDLRASTHKIEVQGVRRKRGVSSRPTQVPVSLLS